MATRRTTRSKPAETEATAVELPVNEAKPALKAQDLARFLGLKDFNIDQMQALLGAAGAVAEKVIGQAVPADHQGHVYHQGLLHLAAKFYAAGNSDIEKPNDIPMVCRYFFELVRRELSGSAQ